MNAKSTQSWRPSIWVVAGFLLSYILLYVRTVFFNGTGEMDIPKDIHAAWYKLGSDLLGNIHRCQELLRTGQPDAIGFYFSPLWVVIFGWLARCDPGTLRGTVVLLAIGCYVAGCILLPRFFTHERQPSSAAWFLMGAGFASYGMQFEIERGQWNAFVFVLAFGAVALWRRGGTSTRLVSYSMFTLAVHLKIWPIFLVVGFVDLREGCRKNIRRLSWLALANLALLMVLGPQYFIIYLQSVIHKTGDPNVWLGDHSLLSFARQVTDTPAAGRLLGTWLAFGFFSAWLAVTLVGLWRLKSGSHPLMLVFAVVAGMLLPATSNDYKLVVLTMAMCLLWDSYREPRTRLAWAGLMETLAWLAIAFGYPFVVFSYRYKDAWPTMWKMNTPYITIIFVAVAMLLLLRAPDVPELNSQDS